MLYIYPHMSLLSIKSSKYLSANPKTNGDLAVQVSYLHLPELASSGCSCRVTFTTYLIKVYDDIPFQSSTAFHIFQGQGEVNPSGVWDIQVVCVVLVPLLNSCKHLILNCADNMHVLLKEDKRPITRISIFLRPLGHVVITMTYERMEMEHEL